MCGERKRESKKLNVREREIKREGEGGAKREYIINTQTEMYIFVSERVKRKKRVRDTGRDYEEINEKRDKRESKFIGRCVRNKESEQERKRQGESRDRERQRGLERVKSWQKELGERRRGK